MRKPRINARGCRRTLTKANKSEDALLAKNTELSGKIRDLEIEKDAAENTVSTLEVKLRDLRSKGPDGALASKLTAAETQKRELTIKLTTTEAAKAVLATELAEAKTARTTAEARAADFLQKINRTRGKYYIDQVVYGGIDITSQTVINKLLEHAVNGTNFKITNDLMGGDPWRRETKSFTAVYTVGGKGPFKYINCREHDEVRFQ